MRTSSLLHIKLFLDTSDGTGIGGGITERILRYLGRFEILSLIMWCMERQDDAEEVKRLEKYLLYETKFDFTKHELSCFAGYFGCLRAFDSLNHYQRVNKRIITTQVEKKQLFYWPHQLKIGSKIDPIIKKAAKNGHLEIIQWLIEHQLNPINYHAYSGGHYRLLHVFHSKKQKNRLDLISWQFIDAWDYSLTVYCATRQGGLGQVVHVGQIPSMDHLTTAVYPFFNWLAEIGDLPLMKEIYNYFSDAERGLGMEMKKKLLTSRAMDIAASKGHFEIVQFLSTFNLPLSHLCTHEAIDLASSNGHFEIVQFLSTQLKKPCPFSEDAIIFAASNGHLKIIEWFFENRLEEVNTKFQNKHDAMKYAASQNHQQIVKFLLTKFPHEYDVDVLYESIFAFAGRNGHFEMIQLIWAHLKGVGLDSFKYELYFTNWIQLFEQLIFNPNRNSKPALEMVQWLLTEFHFIFTIEHIFQILCLVQIAIVSDQTTTTIPNLQSIYDFIEPKLFTNTTNLQSTTTDNSNMRWTYPDYITILLESIVKRGRNLNSVDIQEKILDQLCSLVNRLVFVGQHQEEEDNRAKWKQLFKMSIQTNHVDIFKWTYEKIICKKCPPTGETIQFYVAICLELIHQIQLPMLEWFLLSKLSIDCPLVEWEQEIVSTHEFGDIDLIRMLSHKKDISFLLTKKEFNKRMDMMVFLLTHFPPDAFHFLPQVSIFFQDFVNNWFNNSLTPEEDNTNTTWFALICPQRKLNQFFKGSWLELFSQQMVDPIWIHKYVDAFLTHAPVACQRNNVWWLPIWICLRGHLDLLVKYCTKCQPLSAIRSRHQKQMLHAALVSNSFTIVIWLLSQKKFFKIQLTKKQQCLILSRATKKNWFHVIKFLANHWTFDTQLLSLMTWKAVQYGHLGFIRWALNEHEKASTNTVNLTKYFHLAITSGHLEIAKWLYTQQEEVRPAPIPEWVVNKAISNGHVQMVQWILTTYNSELTCTFKGLCLGIRTKKVHLIQFLLKHLVIQQKEFTTKIIEQLIVHLEKPEEIEQMLIDSFNKPFDEYAQLIITVACREGHLRLLQAICQKGLLVGCTVKDVMKCVKRNHLTLIEWIFENHFISSEEEDNDVFTKSIQMACRWNRLEVLRWLFNQKLLLLPPQQLLTEKENELTKVFIQEASSRGHSQLVRFLLLTLLDKKVSVNVHEAIVSVFYSELITQKTATTTTTTKLPKQQPLEANCIYYVNRLLTQYSKSDHLTILKRILKQELLACGLDPMWVPTRPPSQEQDEQEDDVDVLEYLFQQYTQFYHPLKEMTTTTTVLNEQTRDHIAEAVKSILSMEVLTLAIQHQKHRIVKWFEAKANFFTSSNRKQLKKIIHTHIMSTIKKITK